jgi:hypothetical protein
MESKRKCKCSNEAKKRKFMTLLFLVALQSLKDLGHLTYKFLDPFRHMVGLLRRVISPSQGLYLHRTT